MTLTEEEAKNKLCQETFAAPHSAWKCSGSNCMAWCWIKKVGADGYSAVDTDKGYCGKAAP